jgi:hypothetical protein
MLWPVKNDMNIGEVLVMTNKDICQIVVAAPMAE